jgi:non-ribosomal peptide synthase protein (TIGR01720 family)
LTITALFAPLVAGRRVQMLPEDIGVELLSSALANETNYSVVKITPSHLDLLSQQMRPEEMAGRTRAFIIGGENLLARDLTIWQDAAPDTMLINEYGPTETVVGCCVYRVPLGERRSGSVPIGRPIINTQLYILDAHMEPVPTGVAGELYIGGDGVARGYLRRPELTAERFVPDPFAEQPGARLYKTGDLCRYFRDGNIEFLGRTDHQVKIRGFRIELGEIESVLVQRPGVQDAVVVAREVPFADQSAGHTRLVAYVVPDETSILLDAHLAGEDLRRHLHDKLPEYMVPSSIVMLDAMPLTPNGKVDRRALPVPDLSRPDLESAYVAPRTPEEQALVDIWANVLGFGGEDERPEIGIHDNFFELGGDSILSIQVIARANQAGMHLTARQIFEHPTVAELAMVAGRGVAIQAEQGPVQGPVPLTPIQRWFFDLALPEPHYWNQALLFQVKQRVEPKWLEKAVQALVEHHDALRLRFTPPGEMGTGDSASASNGSWAQYGVESEAAQVFGCVDLSELSADEHRAAIEMHVSALQGSLDLVQGPLLRVVYFDLGPAEWGRLLFCIHHLAVDAVSWQALLQDLQLAYQQISRGGEARLPPKTTSFRFWAHCLAEEAQSDETGRELTYWQSVLEPPIPRLPIDYVSGDNVESSVDSVTVALDLEDTQALLQDVPAVYRTEINDVLLAALVQALQEWSGQSAALVALEGHGRPDLGADPLREDVDLSRTVGWFTALYPVRLDIAGAAGPAETLITIKEQLRSVPRRGIGYGLLRYLAADGEAVAKLKRAQQPEISFNYLGQIDRALPQDSAFELAAESRGSDRSPLGQRAYLLEIDGGIAGGRLQLEWTYSQNVHRRATVERVAQKYVAALRALIAHCQSPEAGGYTPSDFAEFGWEQQDLDDILAAIGESA